MYFPSGYPHVTAPRGLCGASATVSSGPASISGRAAAAQHPLSPSPPAWCTGPLTHFRVETPSGKEEGAPGLRSLHPPTQQGDLRKSAAPQGPHGHISNLRVWVGGTEAGSVTLISALEKPSPIYQRRCFNMYNVHLCADEKWRQLNVHPEESGK